MRSPESRSQRSRLFVVRAPDRRAATIDMLLRIVERMMSAGHTADAVERYVATWLYERGLGRGDIPEVVRRIGLPFMRAGGSRGHLYQRIDAQARPAVHEPSTWLASQIPHVPRGIVRDERYFAPLRKRAETDRYAMQCFGWEVRQPRAAPAAKLTFPLRETTKGAVAPLRTMVQPTVRPGVYALQRKANGPIDTVLGPSPDRVLARLGRGRALDESLRLELEPLLRAEGRDLDLRHIRVHDDSAAHALCLELHADAFALGRHVVFRAGAFRPNDRQGRALFAHELVHVWQQEHGLARTIVFDDPGLEADADRVAVAVTQRGRDALVDQTRRHLAHTRVRPSATFVVSDRVTAYDAAWRVRGAWDLTEPPPLEPGYWLDGGVACDRWSRLTPTRVDAIARGANDLWVIGAAHVPTRPESLIPPGSEEARDANPTEA